MGLSPPVIQKFFPIKPQIITNYHEQLFNLPMSKIPTLKTKRALPRATQLRAVLDFEH